MERIEEIDWNDKKLDEIPITELSVLRFILNNLPSDIVLGLPGDLHIDEYVDNRLEEFFDVSDEDFENLVGKCFMNEQKTVAIKVVGLRDDKDNPYYESSHYIEEFLYEEYEQYGNDRWHTPDYIWLQETAKGGHEPEYLRWCLTSQTDMNTFSENRYMLGKDGNLYVDMTCGDDYMIFRPISNTLFERIRQEAIENDGEYKVEPR